MPPFRSVEAAFHGWHGVRLTSGDVSVGLAPDIGGRILSLQFRGEELLYVHRLEAGRTFDLLQAPDILAFKKGFGFRIFGGDKTWVAPEKDWLLKSPPLDLDAGRYAFEEKDGVCVMTSPVCRETGLRIVRRVKLEADGTVHLEEEFENTTSKPLLKGIWNVTQIPRPFDVYCSAEPGAIRSYHYEDPTLPDTTQPVEYDEGWAKVPCRSTVCFKFGGVPREGKLVVLRPTGKGAVLFGRRFDLDRTAEYAHRSAVEVFNSAQFGYGEVEVHAPLRLIPPGGRVTLHQVWSLAEAPPGMPERTAVQAFAGGL